MRTSRLGTMRRIGISILACVVLLAAVGLHSFALDSSPTNATRARPPEVVRQVAGSGKWQSQRRIKSLDHQAMESLGDWHVEVTRFDDDSLDGHIVVVGSPVLQQARIEAKISGHELAGVLVDDSKRQIGTFTGTLFKQSVSGTYTMNDGDTGSWSWDAPLPAALTAEP